jgi:hypothetical protein
MATRTHVAEVLFFTSPHCTQCAAVRSTAVDVTSTFEGEVELREIDTSTNREESRRHNVRGVPTLVAIRRCALPRRDRRYVHIRECGRKNTTNDLPTRSNTQARHSCSVRHCSDRNGYPHLGCIRCRCNLLRCLGPDPTVTDMSTSAQGTLRPLNPPTVRHSLCAKARHHRRALLSQDMAVTVALPRGVR